VPAEIRACLRPPGTTTSGSSYDGDVEDGIRTLATADPDADPFHEDYRALTWMHGEGNPDAMGKARTLLSLAKGGRPGAITAWHEYLLNGQDDANAIHTMQRALADPPAGADPEGGIYEGAAEREVRRATLAAEVVNFPTVQDAPQAPDDARYLPDEFWDAHECFTGLKARALASGLSPDALLGVIMARLAAVSWGVTFDAEMGPSPLNLAVGIYGKSGQGKSRVISARRHVVLALSPDRDNLNPSSGEGMADTYFDTISVMAPKLNKDGDVEMAPANIKVQLYHDAMFAVPEVEALNELRGRGGSILWPVIRQAWSGEGMGQAGTRSGGNRRIVPEGSYSWGLVVGVQPAKSADLVSDTGTGTAQRFLWFSGRNRFAGHDARPEVADITRLSPFTWKQAANPEQAMLNGDTDTSDPAKYGAYLPNGGQDIPVSAEVRAEMSRIYRETQAADEFGTDDDGDSHRVLRRLKVAALLSIIARYFQIEAWAWHWAGVVLDASDAGRDALVEHGQRIERQRAIDQGRIDAYRHGGRLNAGNDQVVAHAAIVRAMHAKLARNPSATKRDLHQAAAGKHRKAHADHCTMETMVAEARAA
jgi:hypothetical protein